MRFFLNQIKAKFTMLLASYAIGTDGYPDAPLSTAVPARANTTQALSIASYEEYDNSEIEVVSISKGRTPFFHTVVNLGRGLNGGSYKDLGVNEMLSDNFPEFKWKERDEFNDTFEMGANALSNATTLVFVSTSGLYSGLLLRNAVTNEQIRITSITSATDIVVQRAVGTVAAAAMTAGDALIVLSSSAAKGVSSLSSFYVANQDRSNYFQKFLTTDSIKDFDILSYKINGGEDKVAEKAIQHSLEIEKAMVFGQKKSGIDPVTSEPYYTMEGVIENCKRGWSDDLSSSLTRQTLEDALKVPLKYTKDGSYKKIILCGSKVRGAISNLFEGRLQVNQIKDIDLTFESIKINQGEFIFIEHPMLDETSGYEGIAFVIDPAFLKIMYPTGKNPIDNVGFNGKTRFIINQATKTFAFTEFSMVTYASLMASNSNSGGAFKII